VIDERASASHQLTRALRGEEDEGEAVVDVGERIFNGYAGHGSTSIGKGKTTANESNRRL
jgi:hypothetical protein